MKRFQYFTFTILFHSIFFYSCQQKPNNIANNNYKQVTPVKIDPTQISDGNLIYRMSKGADSIGFSSIKTQRIKDQLVLSEVTDVAGMYEEISGYLNKNTFAMDSVVIKGKAQGFPIASKVIWEGNHVFGKSDFPKHPKVPTHTIDTTLHYSTVERLFSFFCFVQALPLKVDYKLSYNQLNTADCKVRNIKLHVSGVENIKVPAGSYEAFKVTLTGGVASQNLYISNNSKRKIVKISFNDSDYMYELL